ncbi:hypothetical protein P5V15_015771 [Pogonomyrmex californicus]
MKQLLTGLRGPYAENRRATQKYTANADEHVDDTVRTGRLEQDKNGRPSLGEDWSRSAVPSRLSRCECILLADSSIDPPKRPAQHIWWQRWDRFAATPSHLEGTNDRKSKRRPEKKSTSLRRERAGRATTQSISVPPEKPRPTATVSATSQTCELRA